MKLSQFNQDIATACSVKPKVVAAIQQEMFRKMIEALNKGERVQIPGLGVFVTKEAEAEEGKPPKKTIRFRQRGEGDEKSEDTAEEEVSSGDRKKAWAEKKNKRQKAKSEGAAKAEAGEE